MRGYAALMATIIISLVLLVMVAQSSITGWHTRFMVLGVERKEQADALARGCIEQAQTQRMADPTYLGSTTHHLPLGTCTVFPFTIAHNGDITIQVQARVGTVHTAVSNLVLVTNIKTLTSYSVQEVPTVER